MILRLGYTGDRSVRQDRYVVVFVCIRVIAAEYVVMCGFVFFFKQKTAYEI